MFNWITSLFSSAVSYTQAIVTFIITAIVAFALHEIDISVLNVVHSKQLASQKQELVKDCEKDKQITKEVDDAYTNHNASRLAHLNQLNGVYDNTCVPVTGPSSSNHGASSGQGYAFTHEVPARQFVSYAGTCEKYRIQVISLQDFINKLIDSSKQK